MKLFEVMPQAMLFVRGLNSGISHNPLESSTSDDIDLCVRAFSHLLHQLAGEQHRIPLPLTTTKETPR
jgi:N-carbamoyl-L-amino-acid hydrolase